MPVITRIKQQGNGRNAIYINGHYLCQTTQEYATGLQLSREEVEHLAKERPTSALDAAVVYLSTRTRTAKQIKRYLYDKWYAMPEIDAALARLIELRYLDDYRYAQLFLQSMQNTTTSAGAIKRKLQEAGIEAETIAELMDDFMENDENNRVLSVAQKWSKTHAGPMDRKKAASLSAFLFRRGFSGDEIRGAIDAMYAEKYED